MDDYQVRAIDGTIGATSPSFSPDGEWVGFIDANDGKLKKVRLRGGVPVSLCEDPGAFRGLSWGEDGRIYLGHGFGGLQAVSENGGTPEILTTPDRDRNEKTHRFPHVLPGGRGLLFTLATAGIASYDEASIALLDLQTGKHRVLLEGGSQPSYVATGHILYGRRGSLEAVPFDLESMQVTGPPFVVADGVVTSHGWGSVHYTVSHGGTLAYVPGDPERFQLAIYWLDRNGNLKAVPLPLREYEKAVVSPDGQRLAISILGANASIWIYEIERQTMTRLTTEWDNTGPIWMRRGNHVTFSSNRTGTMGFWRIAADGSSRPETLYARDGITGSWSVDDRLFTFSSSSPATASDIWILSADEELGAEPVLQTGFQETSPAFSPDGRWLAYTSDATGQPQVYVQRYPIAGRKWQISADGGDAPLWSPDGRELYYQKGRRLMVVSVTTEPDFAPGKERELLLPEFSLLLSWDMAPDGKRFVIVGRVAEELKSATPSVAGEAASVPEIRVVVDWFEELRRGPS
jgi:serine/threonine-protein kinase